MKRNTAKQNEGAEGISKAIWNTVAGSVLRTNVKAG